MAETTINVKNESTKKGDVKMKFLMLVFLYAMVLQPISVKAEDLVRGRNIFMQNCAVCHGEAGKGDGPRAATLNPKPIDLTNPEVMATVTRERIEKAVVQGLPGLSEHTFGHLLLPDDTKDVIAYVTSLIRK